MQFTKLFSSILDSTIWQEATATKILWITMLAMTDRNGEVHASIPGIAKRAGISLNDCETALESLKSPDPYSRTRESDGRRIADIEGGWALLNHGKYRQLLSSEERREYNRRKQSEYRAKKAADQQKPVTQLSNNVKQGEQKCSESTHTESESESDTDKGKASPLTPASRVLAQKSESQLRIESWFNRRPDTKPDKTERNAWKNARVVVAGTSPDEWDLLERFYQAPQAETYTRKSISVLLNNWQGEIDRAKAWQPKIKGEFSNAW